MDHETVTPHPGANTAWHRTGRGGWLLVGMIGGEDYRSSQIVEVDIARQLAKTTTGKVRHVPGPWPDDLDLPAMRAPVREWVGPDDYDLFPAALATYLTAEVGGAWEHDETCAWLNPTWLDGVTLVVSVGILSAEMHGKAWQFSAQHEATRPDDIARALRREAEFRAWLLAELDAARAVVGGAS